MKTVDKNTLKKRLFEMMEKVNKIKLNEDYSEENLNDVLNTAFEKLKSGALEINHGGSNSVIMQSIDDVSYVVITGYDSDKNKYEFKFKIEVVEGDQDGVGIVHNVTLEKFEYYSPQGQKIFDVDKDDLVDFNNQHGDEMYDVIEKYIDTDTISNEEFNDVSEITDKKLDSDPFGGARQKYQNSKGFGDEKPVNPTLRVKAPELDKFIKEDKLKENSESDDENKEMELGVGDADLDPKDVDKNGDFIPGGKGDNADIMQFDPKQISKGIEVEMEHTNDPRVALEIAMDHLTELPDYYTRLDKMEKQGKDELGLDDEENTEENGNNDLPDDLKIYVDTLNNDDKELENTLLGFNLDTPNTMREDADFATREREYEDKEAYKRYLELDAKAVNDFDSLSDSEKKEFYELWKEFGDVKK